jgi:Flp pilus assembly protein TadD
MNADSNDEYATLAPIVQEHLNEGRFEAAIAALCDHLARNPLCAEAHNDLAVVHHECGHSMEALRCAREAVRLVPDNPQYARNLASLLGAADRLEEALALLLRLLESNPRDLSGLLMLGEANWQLGRIEDAEICFRTACAISAGNEVAIQAHSRCASLLQKKENPVVTALVFSKDRAMQLDAALRSLRLHCRDLQKMTPLVLFKATTAQDHRQYERIARANPGVRFAPETDFFGQLMGFIEASDYVLFEVDDCLFVSGFEIAAMTQALEDDRSALGVSLRLGRNTTRCYMRRSGQRMPEFSAVGPLLRFRWVGAEGDFGYPLEVSSSLYRGIDLREAIARRTCGNPNTLEAVLSGSAARFAERRPYLLCWERSVAFCNPVNMVQTVYLGNRVGGRADYSAQALRARFDAGERIRVQAYSGYLPEACHEEAALEFEMDVEGDTAAG